MCPVLGKLAVNREGEMVCHCLVIETREGLVVVDTGLGLYDLEHPNVALGGPFVSIVRPNRDPATTLVRQLARLGFKPEDVKHIIPTHLDLDHAGGFPDLPGAKVHVYRPELEAATARRTEAERRRYRPHQLKNVSWVVHEADGEGEDWFGFRAVTPILGLDIALVPLIGHTRGHCGVAVKSPSGWLLHCGDAYFHADQMDPVRERCTLGLRFFQRVVAMDNAARLQNVARLRDLARTQKAAVRLFCAHDPGEFKALATAPPARLFA
jgi:glyoxylase-like metal-dependent hydrolase (beta-lactamase superfamily II)